ncbi:MAG: hypothetical protein LH632_16760 [Rhodoferax sp.]|nr:hypothetical protein [Rhodoferax sp.]
MKPNFDLIRLFAPLFAIVALAQAAVTLGLPLPALGDAGLRSTLLSAALLALLADRSVYWRCMAVAMRLPAQAARPDAHNSTGGGVRMAVAMTAAAQLQTALPPLDDALAALDFERALAQRQALTEEVER